MLNPQPAIIEITMLINYSIELKIIIINKAIQFSLIKI
ncbi:hypothetical protein M119_4975 [Bacteroides fragilis str. 3783N1-6]|uniref:Uncharacterized protein n=1 Tax=Bacteroides fragilis str. 3783N1-6 TaxID=1339310 RepID=A0AB73AS41_BACFG|nr:hypothetical protein M120_4835 [Bacteroides fragilis str. 3783N1-8]EYB11855.1 hypothetical protein M119_4975 [Bacteroides fragilis str. 3783N1-6]